MKILAAKDSRVDGLTQMLKCGSTTCDVTTFSPGLDVSSVGGCPKALEQRCSFSPYFGQYHGRSSSGTASHHESP